MTLSHGTVRHYPMVLYDIIPRYSHAGACCSAGIGRTGVLITMETAMCLIEANQPVMPLAIVKQMRDQRAMLIQTPVCSGFMQYHSPFTKKLIEVCQNSGPMDRSANVNYYYL